MTAAGRYAPLLAVAGTIVFLSHQPGDVLPLPSFFLADKLAHFSAYTALGLSAIIARGPAAHRCPPARLLLLTASFCLLFGATDEFHQAFVPLRQPSAADLAADTAGGLLAGWLWLAWRRIQAARPQR